MRRSTRTGESLVRRRIRRAEPPAAKAVADAEALVHRAGSVEEARKALDDATGLARGLWFSFITFGTYLAVASGSVTHRDLFLESPVKLPLLNVDLPLTAFFWVAPVLLVVFHVYLMLNLKLLADNVRRWERLAVASLRHRGDRKSRRGVLDGLRMQLPNFVAVQMRAAPRPNRRGFVGVALFLAVAGTVVVGPVALLCEMLLKFLPYHSAPVTWLHRAALAADIAAIGYFWGCMVGGGHWTRRRRVWPVWALLSAALVTLAFFFATFPGEAHHRGPVVRFADAATAFASCAFVKASVSSGEGDPYCAKRWILSRLLFEGDVNNVTGQRKSLFSSTIVVPNQDFVPEAEKDLAELAVTRSFRGRDLEGAVLARADLRKADFTGALLNDAEFGETHLQGASFAFAQLQGASLAFAELQGASLYSAQLQGASLGFAQLQGASLTGVRLQGASLGSAQLQGASLGSAQLQGAYLGFAQLQGAYLGFAQLQGSSLYSAQMQGALLASAQLQGATLRNALVWRVRRLDSAIVNVVATDRIDPSPVYRDGLETKALDAQAYASVLKSALSGLTDAKDWERVRQSLQVLDLAKPDLGDSLSGGKAEQFWNEVRLRYDPKTHAELLGNLACNNNMPPYVAAGIILRLPGSGIIGEVEGQSASIASRILDGIEAGTCPGAVGISDQAMAQLREWAPDWKPKALRDRAAGPAKP